MALRQLLDGEPPAVRKRGSCHACGDSRAPLVRHISRSCGSSGPLRSRRGCLMPDGYREFEFDLPEALLMSLTIVLDAMEPAPLSPDKIREIPDTQGVYQ